MKKKYLSLSKSWLILTALFLCLNPLKATTEVGGIGYELNSLLKTAVVTSRYNSSPKYSGNIVIPNEITYYGTKYKVVGINNYAFSNCTNLISVEISEGVTYVNDGAFSGCSSLTSVILPTTVNTISSWSFKDCVSLSSFAISTSVTTISSHAFEGCINLKSITIPNNVTSIAENAFLNTGWYNNQSNGLLYLDYWLLGYKGKKPIGELKVAEGTKGIAIRSFSSCEELTSVNIPSSMEYIYSNTFYRCDNLICVTLNNNAYLESSVYGRSLCDIFGPQVKKYILNDNLSAIGPTLFRNCTFLQETIIPKQVKSIGEAAFYNCKSLKNINIPSSIETIGKSVFYGCDSLEKVIIPDMTSWLNASLGDLQSSPLYYAHHIYKDENNELKEVIIPDGVTSIGNYKFYGCYYIESIIIPSSVKSLENAFNDCKKLTRVTINSNDILSVNRSIDRKTDNSLSKLLGEQVKNIIIGHGVKNIGNNAFYKATNVSSVILPSTLQTIGYNAFYSCNNIKSIYLPDSIVSIGNYAFSGIDSIYVKKGTNTLLSLWNANYTPYQLNTKYQLPAPTLKNTARTQVTATINVSNIYPEYTYKYQGEIIKNNEIKLTGLRPELTYKISIDVVLDDVIYRPSVSFTTLYLNAKANTTVNNASSATIKGIYTKGDAIVTSTSIKLNYKTFEGDSITVTGLDPGKSYTAQYIVNIKYDDNNTYTFYGNNTFTTESLKLTTQQPKVVSVGNVIVAAESNLDDEETNVGFEWRRTDWTDDFVSNKGNAYLYEGVMEGYIRNLYAEKLWKYRPYYTSDSGNTYYGEWVGLDPTNTSYFEPTVHTYAKVDVSEGTATLNGYVMTGTDAITEQGFEYWTTDESSNAQHRAPQNVQTIKATGQRMTAKLTGLKNNTTYYYRAYVKTVNNTTYGEERSFKTPIITGIKQLSMSENQPKTFNIYTLSGSLVRHQATTLEGLSRGIYIVNRKKIMVK